MTRPSRARQIGATVLAIAGFLAGIPFATVGGGMVGRFLPGLEMLGVLITLLLFTCCGLLAGAALGALWDRLMRAIRG